MTQGNDEVEKRHYVWLAIPKEETAEEEGSTDGIRKEPSYFELVFFWSG